MPQPELLHPEVAEVLEPLILLAHSLGILVNLLLGKVCKLHSRIASQGVWLIRIFKFKFKY